MSILALSKATGISYTTLHPHVRHGKAVSLETAKRLEAWSAGGIKAAEVLGIQDHASAPQDLQAPAPPAA
jgi:hypothetical protein